MTNWYRKLLETMETNEMLEERLSKNDSAEAWIRHFVHSENPKFDGKSKQERIKMALGAYYALSEKDLTEASNPHLMRLTASPDDGSGVFKTVTTNDPELLAVIKAHWKDKGYKVTYKG